MLQHPRLTVRELRARAVNVPMSLPLETSGGTVSTAPLVLIDLHTEEGITGCSYVFCYTPLALRPVAQLITNLEALIKGDRVAPVAIEQKLQRRFRLLGPQGLTGIAMAGIDMAAWDALAKACDVPLVKLLGGEPRPIPAYNSRGLGIIGAERAAAEAQELLSPGFNAIKLRLGYPDLRIDVEVVRAVRRAVGENVLVMSDYNQSLSVPEAIRRTQALDQEGLYWIEEPTLAGDFEGHARISRETRTPVQLGENWWGAHDMAKSIAAGASDFAMPDAMKIGGVTGWLRAAALAEVHGLPVSSHLFPEISAHLLAVTPTCHWLEFVDWANPILAEPLKVQAGHAIIPDRPGIGISWNEEGVRHCLAE
ncbi:MAG TPA: enolase C-terminal domain-like protein [Blastocatellia bacterium]|nr:enolase C-terminal domain-like protein [Blastocatellia bacterium]